MNKNCVVTLSNHRGNYLAAQDRLVKSLVDVGYKGGVLAFRSEGEVGAPPHITNPYAFKIKCFERAYDLGYRNILYLDSSVWAIKPIDSIFETIETEGYIMQEAGHFVGDFCNDATLEYYGLSRLAAKNIPMYGNAGFLGLKLSLGFGYHPKSSIGDKFLEDWRAAMHDGMFRGDWEGPQRHRHDMTCGSISAHRLRMKYKPGDQILQYVVGDDRTPINDTIQLFAQGM